MVISGPSGSGKGTVLKRLDGNGDFARSISFTTRKKRDYETENEDYFFCSEEEFHDKVHNGEFLEYATFVGNYYGTPCSYVESEIEKGKTVVLEIDVNGAIQIKEKFPECVLVFLIPPTFAELRRRLINRSTEPMLTVEERLNRAKEEIKLIYKYDYLVINDDIDEAIRQIINIVEAEKLKPGRSAVQIERFKN